MDSAQANILIIDDDPTIRTLLQTKLAEQGYEIMTAVNGEEGLKKVPVFKPDLIILDIMMPVMDGYTFVLEFKKNYDIRETPIIIETSQQTMKDIFEIQGINDYIVKPFHMEDLLRKIDKRLKAKVKRVLVVDDEEDIVHVIESRLRANGYDVTTAFNGMDGLNRAKKDRPDLIILDCMLPKLDGYKVCRMLKFDQKFKHIAVILLTALSTDDRRELGNQVGADAYLLKPFDAQKLLQTMKELLWD